MFPQGNVQKLCSRHRDGNFILIDYSCVNGTVSYSCYCYTEPHLSGFNSMHKWATFLNEIKKIALGCLTTVVGMETLLQSLVHGQNFELPCYNFTNAALLSYCTITLSTALRLCGRPEWLLLRSFRSCLSFSFRVLRQFLVMIVCGRRMMALHRQDPTQPNLI